MPIPIAIIISDVHYNIQTLPLADAAMRQAINMANELKIPLVVAGDLHDTKANMRAECINAMIQTFNICETSCYILRGNHDAISEKSNEHSLNFLGPIVCVIDKPTKRTNINAYLIPYYHNIEELRSYLKTVPPSSAIIMHQGLQGSLVGDYIIDKSAITHEYVADFRGVSGHYHARQDIKTGRPRKGHVGMFSYVGNPFTLGFGEANDPEKGFRVLNNDGSLDFIPTNLRKHVIVEIKDGLVTKSSTTINPEDRVWVKYHGTREQLLAVNKQRIAEGLVLKQDFRLDLIPTDKNTNLQKVPKNGTSGELLDNLIDSMSDVSIGRKGRLQRLWKTLCE